MISLISIFLLIHVFLFIQGSSDTQDETLSFLLIGDWGKGGRNGTTDKRRLIELLPENTLNKNELDLDILERKGHKTKKLYQMQVATAMGIYAASAYPQPSFLIALGDNFYDDGVQSSTDSLWNSLWKDVYLGYKGLNIPWYPVFGNHDYGYGATGVNAQLQRYTEHTDDDIWVFPSTNYTKRFTIPGEGGGSVCIIFIDTTTLAPSVNRCCNQEGGVSTTEQQRRISDQLFHIEKALQEAADDPPTWLLVAGHYPVYSASSNGDVSELIQYLLPLMQQYNVHAYLCGHDHIGEHLQHSEFSTEFFVVGAGSMTDTADSANSEATLLWAGQSYASFAEMRATISSLTIDFLDINRTLRYSYTIGNSSRGDAGEGEEIGEKPARRGPRSVLTWAFWSNTATRAGQSNAALASGGVAVLGLLLFCGYSMYRQRSLRKVDAAKSKFLSRVRSTRLVRSPQRTPTLSPNRRRQRYVELMELGQAEEGLQFCDFSDGEQPRDVICDKKADTGYHLLKGELNSITAAVTTMSEPGTPEIPAAIPRSAKHARHCSSPTAPFSPPCAGRKQQAISAASSPSTENTQRRYSTAAQCSPYELGTKRARSDFHQTTSSAGSDRAGQSRSAAGILYVGGYTLVGTGESSGPVSPAADTVSELGRSSRASSMQAASPITSGVVRSSQQQGTLNVAQSWLAAHPLSYSSPTPPTPPPSPRHTSSTATVTSQGSASRRVTDRGAHHMHKTHWLSSH